jgi:hypothetical protein
VVEHKVHLTTCASGSGAMPPAAVWRLRDSRDLFDDSGDTAVAKKSNGTDDWNSSTVRSTSGTNATCAVKGCTNKIPDNVQKSINNECRKQSIKLVEYTSRPGYKCLCNSHYESLEIKKVVDELPLDSGKVRKASAKNKTVNKVEKVKTESATDKSALQEILQSVSNAKSVSSSAAPTISFAALDNSKPLDSVTAELSTPSSVLAKVSKMKDSEILSHFKENPNDLKAIAQSHPEIVGSLLEYCQNASA